MNIVEINNVWINYKIAKPFSYKEIFKAKKEKKKHIEVFPAVKNVSFNVKRGECLGIIGANGSGKTTLLRAIAKIYAPDNGQINWLCDKMSLLSLGIGFQSRLSGRQNIFLSGLAMGFSKKEIESKVEEIIEFSELGEFIDKPVKTYSSGMYSKLAFAIGIALKTELLLIDEVLSVGDMRFREKSKNKLCEIIAHQSQSVIIVSHDEATLEAICDRVVWLDHGEVKAIGESKEVLDEYKAFMRRGK